MSTSAKLLDPRKAHDEATKAMNQRKLYYQAHKINLPVMPINNTTRKDHISIHYGH